MTRISFQHTVADLHGMPVPLVDTIDSLYRKRTGDYDGSVQDTFDDEDTYLDGRHQSRTEYFVTATSFALGSHLENIDLLRGYVPPQTIRPKLPTIVCRVSESKGYATTYFKNGED